MKQSLLVCALLALPGATVGAAAGDALRLVITDKHVDFLTTDGKLAGRYHHTDEFKPFIHPLNSPLGHCVSLARPHDHRHHKALMYALRIPELNFWEEVSTLPGEKVGRERHVTFSDVRSSGSAIGFTEALSWEPAEGGAAVFDEIRRISLRREGAAFVWNWETALTVRRATKLVQSQWSRKSLDGRTINYHGLGLRMCREFGGGTRNNAVQLDDGPVQWNRGAKAAGFEAAMGAVPARVTFSGHIDGTWPVPRVGVTMAQAQGNGLFILETPFAFMALGPSNLAGRALAAGEVLRESYTVTVADLPSSESK